MRKTATSLALAATLAVSAGPAFGAEVKPVLLKTPIAFATNLPGLGSTIKWVGDRIGTVSNGSVKMKVYEPGKLVAGTGHPALQIWRVEQELEGG